MLKKKLSFGLAVISCVSVLTFLNPSEVFAKPTGTEPAGRSVIASVKLYPREVGIVTAKSGLNVRGGAGTNYAITGSVYYNEKVVIEESDGEWYKISYSTSTGTKYGWVSSYYIRHTGIFEY